MNDRIFYELENGKQISAKGINDNFLKLLHMVGAATIDANIPHPVIVELEVKVAHLEERLDALEEMSKMHARQRNEKEYAPLSSVGAVLVRINDLQKSIETAIARIDAAHADVMGINNAYDERLDDLEKREPSPSLTAHDGLAHEVETAITRAQLALSQAISLRREMIDLRKLVG